MAEESHKFEMLVEDLKCSLDTHDPEDGFYAAMRTAKDPLSQQGYPEDEIWKEAQMFTRAGEGIHRHDPSKMV
jgi:hypothetical protein